MVGGFVRKSPRLVASHAVAGRCDDCIRGGVWPAGTGDRQHCGGHRSLFLAVFVVDSHQFDDLSRPISRAVYWFSHAFVSAIAVDFCDGLWLDDGSGLELFVGTEIVAARFFNWRLGFNWRCVQSCVRKTKTEN